MTTILRLNCHFYLSLISPALFIFQRASTVTNLNQLGGTFTIRDLEDDRKNACLLDFSPLNCDFSQPCAYGSSSENLWKKVDGYSDHPVWQSSFGTPITANPPAAAVQLEPNAPQGTLISDPIPCSKGRSQILFAYWVTVNVALIICAVGQNTQRQVCSDQMNQNYANYPGSISFSFNEEFNEPFTIQYKVFSSDGQEGLVVLDELAFYGQLCDNPPTNCLPGRVIPLPPTTIGVFSSSSVIISSIPSTFSSTLAPTTTSTTTPATTRSTFTQTATRLTTSSQTFKPTFTSIQSSSQTFTTQSTMATQSGQTFASTSGKSTTSWNQTQPPLKIFDNPCTALNCSFEKPGLCNYKNADSQKSKWHRIKKTNETQQLSDLWSYDNYYLASHSNPVSTSDAGKDPAASILESPRFKLKPGQSYNLKLDYFVNPPAASQNIRLCPVTSGADFAAAYASKRCRPLEYSNSNYKGWKRVQVPLENNVYKIYIITVKSTNISTIVKFRLDNIVLEGC